MTDPMDTPSLIERLNFMVKAYKQESTERLYDPDRIFHDAPGPWASFPIQYVEEAASLLTQLTEERDWNVAEADRQAALAARLNARLSAAEAENKRLTEERDDTNGFSWHERWRMAVDGANVWRDEAEALRARVADLEATIAGGCWEWPGKKMPEGYGYIVRGAGGIMAHRAAYEAFVRPIPEALVIDHLCRNPACVRPDHLETVTDRENVLRGTGPSALNARKTECVHGHPFTPENTYIDKRGRRVCKACRTDGRRRYEATPRGKETMRLRYERKVAKRG